MSDLISREAALGCAPIKELYEKYPAGTAMAIIVLGYLSMHQEAIKALPTADTAKAKGETQ